MRSNRIDACAVDGAALRHNSITQTRPLQGFRAGFARMRDADVTPIWPI
jgi:hypothetical protein